MNTIKISASILSADFATLADQLEQTEKAGCDWFHIDVMDGHFAPNITMGPFIVQTCKRLTSLPLDVHLMISNPERHIDAFIEAGASNLSIHVENNSNIVRTLQAIHDAGIRASLVLNPGTPASAIESLLPFVDMVLIMTVNPGYSGQVFMPEMIEKIIKVRSMINTSGLPVDLQVDGGINTQTLPTVLNAGANVIVAASAIFSHPAGIKAGVAAMRETIVLNKNRDH
jgi:ribulose-phosphate 3-epimerase